MNKPVVTFFAALVVGVPVGLFSASSSEEGPSSRAAAAMGRPEEARRSEPVVLADLMEREKERLGRYEPGSLRELLENWTDAEVKAAFLESLKSPAGLFASEVEDSLANLLFAEWVRRDFDGALEWFEGPEEASPKRWLVRYLSEAWPKERAEEGLAFAVRNAELFTSSSVWKLFNTILGSRAAQGPEAVEGFLRSLREAGIEARFDLKVTLPDGFDFRTLAEGSEFAGLYQKKHAAALLRAWTAQDADGAFDWLVRSHGPAALRDLADSPDLESQGYLKWLGGKMADLDATQRAEFYGSILGLWVQVPDDMQRFRDGMADADLRGEMDRLSLQMIYAGNSRGAFLFLDAMEDTALRMELLESAEPAKLFTQAPYFRGYDAATEAKLVEKLKAWNASPEQIETIVERFKK